jgi:hypothetical protein
MSQHDRSSDPAQTDQQPAKPEQRPRRGFFRSWLRRGWITFKVTVLVLLLAGVGYVVWTNYQGHHAIERLANQFNKLGIAKDVEIWERQRRGLSREDTPKSFLSGPRQNLVPSAQNGARLMLAAFKVADVPQAELGSVPFVTSVRAPKMQERIHPKTQKAIQQVLKREETFYDLIERAQQYDKFDYAFDTGFHLTRQMSILDNSRSACNLLRLQAVFYQAANRPEHAARSVIRIFQVADSLEHEPYLVTGLVRVSLYALASSASEHLLSRAQLSEDTLGRLADTIERSRAKLKLWPMINSDLARARDELTPLNPLRTANKVASFENLLIKSLGGRSRATTDPLRAPWLERLAQGWWALCPGWFEMQVASTFRPILRRYATLRKAWDDPAKRIHWLRKRTDAQKRSPDAAIAFYPTVETYLQIKARLRALSTAINVETFRIKHGRWPERLHELGGTQPDDPFTDKSLHYRKKDAGVWIYSVGLNGEDDQGFGPSVEGTKGPENADDWSVRLFSVKERASKPGQFQSRKEAESEMKKLWDSFGQKEETTPESLRWDRASTRPATKPAIDGKRPSGSQPVQTRPGAMGRFGAPPSATTRSQGE